MAILGTSRGIARRDQEEEEEEEEEEAAALLPFFSHLHLHGPAREAAFRSFPVALLCAGPSQWDAKQPPLPVPPPRCFFPIAASDGGGNQVRVKGRAVRKFSLPISSLPVPLKSTSLPNQQIRIPSLHSHQEEEEGGGENLSLSLPRMDNGLRKISETPIPNETTETDALAVSLLTRDNPNGPFAAKSLSSSTPWVDDRLREASEAPILNKTMETDDSAVFLPTGDALNDPSEAKDVSLSTPRMGDRLCEISESPFTNKITKVDDLAIPLSPRDNPNDLFEAIVQEGQFEDLIPTGNALDELLQGCIDEPNVDPSTFPQGGDDASLEEVADDFRKKMQHNIDTVAPSFETDILTTPHPIGSSSKVFPEEEHLETRNPTLPPGNDFLNNGPLQGSIDEEKLAKQVLPPSNGIDVRKGEGLEERQLEDGELSEGLDGYDHLEEASPREMCNSATFPIGRDDGDIKSRNGEKTALSNKKPCYDFTRSNTQAYRFPDPYPAASFPLYFNPSTRRDRTLDQNGHIEHTHPNNESQKKKRKRSEKEQSRPRAKEVAVGRAKANKANGSADKASPKQVANTHPNKPSIGAEEGGLPTQERKKGILSAFVEGEVGLWTTDVGDEDILSVEVENGGKKKRFLTEARRKAKQKVKHRKRIEKEKKLGIRRLVFKPPAKETETPLCQHYIKGKCSKGQDCQYSHDTIPETKSMYCRYFLNQSCFKGDDCPFSHDLASFPCKHFHAKGVCKNGESCRFSHKPITEEAYRELMKKMDEEHATRQDAKSTQESSTVISGERSLPSSDETGLPGGASRLGFGSSNSRISPSLGEEETNSNSHRNIMFQAARKALSTSTLSRQSLIRSPLCMLASNASAIALTESKISPLGIDKARSVETLASSIVGFHKPSDSDFQHVVLKSTKEIFAEVKSSPRFSNYLKSDTSSNIKPSLSHSTEGGGGEEKHGNRFPFGRSYNSETVPLVCNVINRTDANVCVPAEMEGGSLHSFGLHKQGQSSKSLLGSNAALLGNRLPSFSRVLPGMSSPSLTGKRASVESLLNQVLME